MAYDKYQKLKLQYSYNGTYWSDVVPPKYKVGDLIEENSPDCGGHNTIYRWYALPDEYVCEGYNKHYKEVYQQSKNEGFTWTNVSPEQTRTGTLIEANSIDCGYGLSWEVVPDEYICEENTNSDIEYLSKDVFFYDNNAEKLVYVKGEEWSSDEYPSDRYTPIGIVMQKPSFYNDGKGGYGVMAISEIKADDPTGAIEGDYLLYNLKDNYPKGTFIINGGSFQYGRNICDDARKETGSSVPPIEQFFCNKNDRQYDYLPQIELCNEFYTKGTKPGDWYLPTADELYIDNYLYVTLTLLNLQKAYKQCKIMFWNHKKYNGLSGDRFSTSTIVWKYASSYYYMFIDPSDLYPGNHYDDYFGDSTFDVCCRWCNKAVAYTRINKDGKIIK